MDKKKLKSILKIVLGAGVIYFLITVVINLLKMPDEMNQSISEVSKEWAQGPAQEAFNVKFIYSDSAQIKAILEAPHAIEKTDSTGKNRTRMFDKSFKVTFFSETGVESSIMTADTGEVKNQAEQGEAWGNVVIVSNADSSTVKTERLFWDNKIGRIWTNEKVNITTENEIIYGDSMEADSGFAKFRIYKVYGTVQLEGNEI